MINDITLTKRSMSLKQIGKLPDNCSGLLDLKNRKTRRIISIDEHKIFLLKSKIVII